MYVLLRYSDMTKPTFIFVDAHIFGAMLAQGDDITSAKPIAFASRTISQAESWYPQSDLEAKSIDFGLRRFRDFTVGSPNKITTVTDHKLLCSIFNGNRQDQICTERIKLQHQDICYTVKSLTAFQSSWLPVMTCQTNTHVRCIWTKWIGRSLNNPLYTLHTTPMDHIGIAAIAKATNNDEILKQLQDTVTKGQTWIPKTAKKE